MKRNMIEHPEFAIGETVFAAEFHDGASDGSDKCATVYRAQIIAIEIKMTANGTSIEYHLANGRRVNSVKILTADTIKDHLFNWVYAGKTPIGPSVQVTISRTPQ